MTMTSLNLHSMRGLGWGCYFEGLAKDMVIILQNTTNCVHDIKAYYVPRKIHFRLICSLFVVLSLNLDFPHMNISTISVTSFDSSVYFFAQASLSSTTFQSMTSQMALT